MIQIINRRWAGTGEETSNLLDETFHRGTTLSEFKIRRKFNLSLRNHHYGNYALASVATSEIIFRISNAFYLAITTRTIR